MKENKIKLRRLELKDASFMLEWMQDKFVVCNMQNNFLNKSLDDCVEFINKSNLCSDSVHLAIVSTDDVYLGTVSLKNITEDSAEFAIAICSRAMGKGISAEAMKQMISLGFNKLGLEYIYWCVSPENIRALKFYDKNGYQRVNVEELLSTNGYNKDQLQFYIWYKIDRNR